MSDHTILAPSGHDRWGNCAGALAACKDRPEDRSSEAAALGTAKHSISEYILTGDFPDRGCGSMVGQKVEADGFTFPIDDKFADHVDTYVNYVNSRPGQKLYEVKLSTAHIFGVPGQGGTSDCIHKDYELREIEVIDAKFGWVVVGAKHKQLRDYGAAALTLFDLEGQWDTVRCTIVQPQDPTEPVKSHVYTRAEIEAYILEERPKAQLAFKLWESPPVDLLRYLTPSDEACAWCPIAGGCVARTNRIVNMFEACNLDEKHNPFLLTEERLAELLAQVDDIAAWAKDIQATAYARALAGKKLPGWKMVQGRKGNRAWTKGSESDVESALGMVLGEDKMYMPRKLVSPTQAEAVLKASNAKGIYATLAPFVYQADGQPSLVPVSTKGEELTFTQPEFAPMGCEGLT